MATGTTTRKRASTTQEIPSRGATAGPAKGASAKTAAAATKKPPAKTAPAKTGDKAPGANADGAASTKKTAATIKLNDRQRDFLKKISGAGEAGYQIGEKVEQRTIEALVERKLVKRGAKNKETGKHPYMLTKAGQKQLTTADSAPSSASSSS